jgi:hypothetical protein
VVYCVGCWTFGLRLLNPRLPLAETYDPNMLAPWGTSGMAADAAEARALYQKVFGLGVTRAQNRLDALRP